jgi:hypothetical protein
MKFKFSLALLISAIVLASCASATLISTSLVGGAGSAVQNGGTSGTQANEASYFQSLGVSQFIDPEGTGFGKFYDNVLSEYVSLNANIPTGQTGSASASFDTQTPQAFTYTNPAHAAVGDAVTSTSLNGALAVSVTKTKTDGFADANAYMLAQSGAGSTILGSSAKLYADERITGNGTALAQVSKATATANSLYTDPASLLPMDFSKSSVSGDIKLMSKSTDDSPLAISGGTIGSVAYISADSFESAPLAGFSSVGGSRTVEYMELNANRGQSFSGSSYADGFLNGNEMAESTWNDPYNNNGFGLTKATVDTESVSQITGSVIARNVRDTAKTQSYLIADSYTQPGGTASASATVRDWAEVTRDSTGSSGLKAEGNAYIPIARWLSSGSITQDFANPQVGNIASVAGNQGLAWDGQPAKNSGFGVGAWILNAYNRPQTALTLVTEAANTAGIGGVKSYFDVYLDGMSAITGTQGDAVGAFGAVANQVNSVKGTNPVIVSRAPQIKDVNAINWLVGDDPNPVPGISQGKYSPADITVDFPNHSAIERNVDISYTQSNPA